MFGGPRACRFGSRVVLAALAIVEQGARAGSGRCGWSANPLPVAGALLGRTTEVLLINA